MLSEVVSPEDWLDSSEAWLRAVSLKIMRELKPGDFSLKLPIHTHEAWLVALEAWWEALKALLEAPMARLEAPKA